ncbi:MAG: hypothetical protein CMG17_05730 [Candidatus Marinimicrobia bacterium]|nr:hypothetical protein [Candidatus Neomarinimicrobiota bacterium]
MNEKGKLVVFIGGSEDHIAFLRASKSKGLKTVVFDLDNKCASKKEADLFFQISTHDFEEILLKLKELSKEYCISGVMTYSSSPKAILNTSKISAHFETQSYSFESASMTIDKSLMKKAFLENDVPTAEARITRNAEEAIDFFENCGQQTMIMKPSSGVSGSKGISQIKTAQEIINNYDHVASFSTDSKVIIESFIDGDEYSIDGIISKNNPIILSVCKKYSLGKSENFIMSGFTSVKQSSSSKDEVFFERIENATAKALEALKISDSLFSLDIIASRNEVNVVECGILLDCKIDRLLSFMGINIYEMMISVISGQSISSPKVDNSSPISLNFLFANKSGYFQINQDAVDQFKGQVFWEQTPGSLVSKPKSISDILGWTISVEESKPQKELYFLNESV